MFSLFSEKNGRTTLSVKDPVAVTSISLKEKGICVMCEGTHFTALPLGLRQALNREALL